MANIKKVGFYFIISIFALTGCAVPKKHVYSGHKIAERKQYSRPVMPSQQNIPTAAAENQPVPSGMEISQAEPALIEKKVKIGITLNSVSINIACAEGGMTVFNEEDGSSTKLPAGQYRAVTDNDGISFDGQLFRPTVRIKPNDGGQGITVNGSRYRGSVTLIRINKGITAINEIGIEGYVCGIITREISASWPVESIKAQAVVARTYAVKNIGKHKKEGFDLCNKQHCQVYGGMDAENPVSDRAVYDNAGEVLYYDGKIAATFYHSSCGGGTEDANKVWNMGSDSPEYLEGVGCGFCKGEPFQNWRSAFKLSDIATDLTAAGIKAKRVKSIRTSGRTSSGRVKYVVIKHTAGTSTISSHRFRMMIGSDQLRSTNFKVKIKGSTAYFEGHGWGHGVGMCQWGAKGLAEKGRDYKEILKYYYDGCELNNYE